MDLVSNLSIRSRLLIGILLPVLLTAGVSAWLTFNQIQQQGTAEVERLRTQLISAHKTGLKQVVDAARTAIEEVYTDPYLEKSVAQTAARDIIRSMGFGENNYIYAWTYDSYNLAFRPKPSAEGPSRDSTPARKELLRNLISSGRSGQGFHEYVWPNPATNQPEPKISYSIDLPEWEWVIGAGIYVTDVDKAVSAAQQEIEANIAAALSRILWITLFIVGVAILLGIFIGRTVTRPLASATRMMQEIAEGDGDLTQRLPAHGNDELSELGRQFNAFVAKIQRAITQVGETTDQLASAAEELSHIATETQASVELQGSETDQIASAINEMAATVLQIAGNATEVESAASVADEQSRLGRNTVLSSQDSVRQLFTTLQESARMIEALAGKSDEIQSVVNVIREVTEQTNLLALNAAIEAARAGEMGRGFAVVADEVRQLASRSGESATQIRAMIESYVDESKKAADHMKSAQAQSEHTVSAINEAAGSLQTIEESVGMIRGQIIQVAAASEQQSHVAEDINRNVVSIVNAAAQSSTGVSQTSDASNELARLGENLRQLVSQFRVH
ncbi:methyl-accepting chemotaxis protein [Pseudomonas sp. OIL-1]|uniref:methyl-accepting chemotaxis protein n=1 Tax=Pseudomonas sp. OIL-1 TaxID=2706126 RepID=UPI0013A7678E|nr:methyl-accepting chemotaxis protein [Pseudomonas sp. OIL-1]QIB51258.1 methyl-accepting chemotaxis protein [Pseudomonas sp. OIL-1]